MADNTYKSEDRTVKNVVEVEAATISEVSDEEEEPKTTWQMASQYRAAILWSSFIGLAGINWGMDTLVSANKLPLRVDLTPICSSRTASSQSPPSRKTSDTISKAST